MADNPEPVANHPEPIEPPVTLSQDAAAAMEAFNSVKVSLADLCAKGTAQYAHKNYEEASDLYSQASELQAELNGEMSPENAEILFLYGRSVFKVGQGKSDVLGGRASGEKKKEKKKGAAKSKAEKPKEEEKTKSELVAEEGVAIIADQASGAKEEVEAKKPLFQFTGDENFEDSDDEDAEVCTCPRAHHSIFLQFIRAMMRKEKRRRRKTISLQLSKFWISLEFCSPRN